MKLKYLRQYIRETIREENDRILTEQRLLLEEKALKKILGWVKNKGKDAIVGTKKFFISLKQELSETKEGIAILTKMASGTKLSKEESVFLKQQIKDISLGVPLLGLVALPGGGIATVALVKAAKKFGVELMPTSFR